MSDFDKYAREGAYHWSQVNPKHPRFNPPLLARYQMVLRQVPSGLQRAVDIGCGDGYLTYLLREKARHVVGLDPTWLGVQLAQAEISKQGAQGIELLAGSAYDLPLPSGAFDLAVSTDVIEHVEHPEQLAREMSRILKPDGWCIISTPNWHPQRQISHYHVQEFTPDALTSLLQPYFRQIDIIGCWHERWMTIWRRRGRRAQLINRFAGYGLNVFTFSTRQITTTYQQLIVVCRR